MIRGATGGIALAALALALAFAGAAAAQQDAAAAAHVTVLRARSLIDGVSPKARRHVDIVIRGNRILDVLETGSRPAPEGADVIDLG